eukprot:TRINITY_DN65583_c0_g1_i1.p1 TRINITY_DN65583_c0_g1~~TRINITY_DN65583_c0_g1_i1.p1  ORF type:complete len:667 (+),score=205.45 TRINITY_DN65583_c0_g1_i1:171-2171(+)
MVWGPAMPFLWMLKCSMSCGAAGSVSVAGWHLSREAIGSALPARTRAGAEEKHARRAQRRRLRRPSPKSQAQAQADAPASSPPPESMHSAHAEDSSSSEEESDGDGEEDDEDRAITTNIVQGMLWGTAVGMVIAFPASVTLLKLKVRDALPHGVAAALMLTPIWIVGGGMGARQIARNLPTYASRLVLTSSIVMLCCGPAMYIWGKAVLKISSIRQLKAVSAKTLKNVGIKKAGKKLLSLVSNGKLHTLTNDTTLVFVSGVRVVVYGHAAIFMWHFANRYPTVQRAKQLREGATRMERGLNELAIILTQVMGNACAACWFVAVILDAPGVIASDWLMIWPPYIWSYCILVHLQAPSDEHDVSRGIQMLRMAWFGLACTSMLPDFNSVHWKAIQGFLATAGYGAWLGTFNGEWQRLCAPVQPDDQNAMALVHPRKWVEERRQRGWSEERRQRRGIEDVQEAAPTQHESLRDGATCAKTGKELRGQELHEQVVYLRPGDRRPLSIQSCSAVPTQPYETACLRRHIAQPRVVRVPAGLLREQHFCSAYGELRLTCGTDVPGLHQLYKGPDGECRALAKVNGAPVRTPEELQQALAEVDGDEMVEVIVSHCSVDPDALHPADAAVMRMALHRLASLAGTPATWDDNKGRWTYDKPRWRFLRVECDSGGTC